MAGDSEIFKHVMQKQIGKLEYWRKIEILEEGPYVFRVIQEHQVSRTESPSKLKPLELSVPGRSEWICPSKEAATEQALRCLLESKKDDWLFSPSASSAA